ncbi:hypothetical protein [Chishuiella sp.]|uniref:hypothetical protein n=1 Tax=Chishuiella sp. TaxID=1969467 RepID=UPI0028A8F556|nr:hypothetical protein [Chishuiella sp.]
MDFNEKLAVWLAGQNQLFEDQSIQEEVFSLIDNDLEHGCLDEEAKVLILKILKSTLSLSFILKNNIKDAEKLIKYLE